MRDLAKDAAPVPDEEPRDSGALTARLARGTGQNLVGFVVRIFLVFLHSLVAARLFGAEAYGVYSVGVAAVALLSVVGQLGLGRTTTRFVALYSARNEAWHVLRTLGVALCLSLPVSAVLGLALNVGAGPMSMVFGEPKLASSFRVFCFAVPLLTLATLLAAFTQGFSRMRHKVLAMDILCPAVELVGLLVVAAIGLRQVGLSLAYMLSVAAAAALLIYYASKDVRRLKQESADAHASPAAMPIKPVLVFAMPVLAGDTLMSATSRANTLVLGAFGTSAMVGVFSIMQRLTTVGTTLLVSLNYMLGPMVADLVERRRIDALSRLYKISTRWATLAGLPFYLLLGFLGSDLLRLFGAEFAVAGKPLWYLAIAGIINAFTGSCGVVLLMSGRPQYTAMNQAIALGLLVTLSALLVPQYGLLGAAFAAAVGTITVNILRVVQVWLHLRILPFSVPFLRVVLAGAGMSLVLWGWGASFSQTSPALLRVWMRGAVALLVYVGLLALLGLEQDETALLRKLLRRCSFSRVVAQ